MAGGAYEDMSVVVYPLADGLARRRVRPAAGLRFPFRALTNCRFMQFPRRPIAPANGMWYHFPGSHELLEKLSARKDGCFQKSKIRCFFASRPC